MDKFIDLNDKNLISRIAFFPEWSPNPIVCLNLLGEFIYLNLSARTQFPTLSDQGRIHPILSGLADKFSQFKREREGFVVFSRDISYANVIYEQQVFAIIEKDCVFIYMNDVTDKKSLEENLKKTNAELQHRVNKRTKQLQDAKEIAESLAEKAETANRAKSAFLVMMSHELRTLLNSVFGMTNLLLETTLNSEQRQFANVILSSGDILLSAINDIIEFSKFDSDQMQIENTEFSLRKLVDNVIDLTVAKINKSEIEIVAFIGEDIPDLFIGDSIKLDKILNIFFSNAVKSKEPGEVKLNVKLLPLEKSSISNKVNLLFEIIDTCFEISPEDLQKIFQKFVNADSSITRKYDGTGLGLIIAKYLIELMNGTLSVKNTTGKGCVFSFILPLSKV